MFLSRFVAQLLSSRFRSPQPRPTLRQQLRSRIRPRYQAAYQLHLLQLEDIGNQQLGQPGKLSLAVRSPTRLSLSTSSILISSILRLPQLALSARMARKSSAISRQAASRIGGRTQPHFKQQIRAALCKVGLGSGGSTQTLQTFDPS